MKIILTIILLFIGSIAYSQEWNSQLTIKCPAEYELSLNGYVQTIKGELRQFGFNLPKGNTHKVQLLVWDKNRTVKYDNIIELKGGENNIVDITQKVLPQKPKKGFEKPNFKDIIKCQENIQDVHTSERRFSSWVHIPTSVGSTPTARICVTY